MKAKHLCLALLSAWVVLGFVSSASGAGEITTPLYKSLGRHHYPISTKYELAQRYFDQGLTLLYNFNHAEAIRSFEAATQIDANSAMPWWGIAYAHGPNINAPMFPEAVSNAWTALGQALQRRDKATEKERALIDALAKRYAQNPPADRVPLDLAYANAMRELAQRFPEDDEVQTLFAEAVMDTSPWNYWTPELKLKPSAAEAVAAIEKVLARTRGHIGADHLYIHLVEAGPNPELGVPSAERVAKAAPGAGHLVHMASHIYVRVGRYREAAEVNERAVKSDEVYFKQTKAMGLYPGGYYPHNLHFLGWIYDIEGRSREAIRTAEKLSQFTIDLRCGAVEGPRQRYAPLLAWARFGRWSDILAYPEPGAEYPFDRALRHYARGLAFAATEQPDAAAQEQAKFLTLAKDEKVRAMDNPYFPGTQILGVATEVLAGKVALGRGLADKAASHFKMAVSLQDAMPYMEPPYWYFSSRLSLGAALLKGGRAADAEQVFREDLKHFPACGWQLFGLEQSLRAQKKYAEADDVQRQLRSAWKTSDVKPDLAWY